MQTISRKNRRKFSKRLAAKQHQKTKDKKSAAKDEVYEFQLFLMKMAKMKKIQKYLKKLMKEKQVRFSSWLTKAQPDLD